MYVSHLQMVIDPCAKYGKLMSNFQTLKIIELFILNQFTLIIKKYHVSVIKHVLKAITFSSRDCALYGNAI